MAEILTLHCTIRGTAPLLMHNERLVNPFDPLVKAIAQLTSKRTKQTDEDRLQVQRYEWEGGLYLSPTLGPYIPAANLKKCLMEAATVHKDGAAVKRALTPLDVEIPLVYDGPRTLDALWRAETYVDVRSVRLNGRTRVQRARPRFETWGLETRFLFNPNILSLDALMLYVEEAGLTTGLGDYRPTFGRFLGKVTMP